MLEAAFKEHQRKQQLQKNQTKSQCRSSDKRMSPKQAKSPSKTSAELRSNVIEKTVARIPDKKSKECQLEILNLNLKKCEEQLELKDEQYKGLIDKTNQRLEAQQCRHNAELKKFQKEFDEKDKTNKTNENEKQITDLKRNYCEKVEQLKQKSNDLETLKCGFLAERQEYEMYIKSIQEREGAHKIWFDKMQKEYKAKVEQIKRMKQYLQDVERRHNVELQKKDQKINDLLQEHQVKCHLVQKFQAELQEKDKIIEDLVQKCKADLQEKDKRIKDLVQESQAELQEKDKRIEDLVRERNLVFEKVKAERQSMKALMAEHQVKCNLVQKSQAELQEKDKRIEDLVRERNLVFEKVKAERQSMKALMADYQVKRSSLDTMANECQNKCKVLKKDYVNKTEVLKNDYENHIAKLMRYIEEYKRYSQIKKICGVKVEKKQLTQCKGSD